MNYFKNQKGFTLTELIVGMVIFIMLLGGIYQALIVITRSQQYNFEAAANVQGEREILNNISIEIRNAVEISSPIVGISENAIKYKKDGDVDYRTIAIGQGSDADTIVFSDASGVIIQRYGQGRSSQLTFQRDSAKIITVQLTIKNTVKSNAPSNTISTAVYTLN